MMRLIVILLIAGAVYSVYNNWSDISANFLNSAKQEKTINAVDETRSKLYQDAQDAME